jgi:O-antigen/teichoic acid export membrane protein
MNIRPAKPEPQKEPQEGSTDPQPAAPRRLNSRHITSLFNVSLRIAGLFAKLALSIYMGRYFRLEDIGVYGLIFGVVMMAVAVLGFRMDYVISRSLVGTSPLEALNKMRDQTIFYLINYAVAAVAILCVMINGHSGLNDKFLLVTFVLVVLESYGNMIYINMNSLGKPTMANLLFFFRSGLWVIPVMALWIFSPGSRTVDSVLMAWLIGAGGSILFNFYLLRHLPWKQLFVVPVNWVEIRRDVLKCLPIWVGGLGISGGAYVDRFIVAHYWGLKQAGIASFYFQFTYSLLALVQSGVLTIAAPRMVKFNKEKNGPGFWKETRETGMSVLVFAGVISLAIAACVPIFGHVVHREELVANAPTLWLMLVGIFIRSNADTLYYILFARHQDLPVWLGNLLYLVPAFGFNLLLVPYLGLIGIGIGGILAALMLFVFRLWFVWKPEVPVTV